MDIEAFGQRLRELRNGKSQTDIVKLIFEKTGLSITAQTLGRYENGKRKPDIEIIEALANTFDVSADYLLCRSDVKSTDIDLKAVCEYTGLDEKSIKCLKKIKAADELYDNKGFLTKTPLYEKKEEILSAVISEEFLIPLIGSMYQLDERSEVCLNAFTFYKLEDIMDLLGWNEDEKTKLFAKAILLLSCTPYNSEEDTVQPFNSEEDTVQNNFFKRFDTLYKSESVEVIRYNNTKLIEKLNDKFDHSKDYMNYDKEQLNKLIETMLESIK